MNLVRLDYDDDGFAVQARKLITSQRPFAFRISGEAFRELEPMLRDGAIVDLPKLGLRPVLRRLLSTLLLAEVEKQRVLLDAGPDWLDVTIGGGTEPS
jgi:hypothetical protein